MLVEVNTVRTIFSPWRAHVLPKAIAEDSGLCSLVITTSPPGPENVVLGKLMQHNENDHDQDLPQNFVLQWQCGQLLLLASSLLRFVGSSACLWTGCCACLSSRCFRSLASPEALLGQIRDHAAERSLWVFSRLFLPVARAFLDQHVDSPAQGRGSAELEPEPALRTAKQQSNA